MSSRSSLLASLLAAATLLAVWASAASAGAGGWLAATFDARGGPIWRVDTTSGARHVLASGVHADDVSWSRDGKTLLYTDFGKSGHLRAVDAAGRALPVDVPNAAFGTFSPDGTHVVYEACVAFCLATSDVHGKDLRYLLKCRCLLYSPAWSPDGKTIAYLRQHDRNANGTPRAFVTTTIRLRGLDGRGDHALVGEHAYCDDQAEPRWSPDGTKIAFTCGEASIYVVDATGGKARAVAKGEVFTWSPDGRSLAFGRQNVHVLNTGTVGIVDLATGRSHTILRGPVAYSLAWHA